MKLLRVYGIIAILPIILLLSIAKAASADECDDKFPKWYQEPDRVRCRAEQRIDEVARYETNKFDLKAEIEQGDWTTSWAEDISETDAAQGLVAGGISIYSASPAAFIAWVEQLVQRTITTLASSLEGEVQQEAERLTKQIISDAVSGKSAKNITKQFDTVDFKGGAIKYSGRNLLGDRTISTTWGLKPYVAFRIRSSSQKDITAQSNIQDIFPGSPVAQGQWSSIRQGHSLITMEDGRVLDWVASDGSWRLWNYSD